MIPRAGAIVVLASALAARGESPAAFGRRCIPADCVAPPSNIPDILGRRALSVRRLAVLGATPEFHHGLLTAQQPARQGGAAAPAQPGAPTARTGRGGVEGGAPTARTGRGGVEGRGRAPAARPDRIAGH